MAMGDLGVSCHSYSPSDWSKQCLMLGDTGQTKRAATICCFSRALLSQTGQWGHSQPHQAPGRGPSKLTLLESWSLHLFLLFF